YKITKLADTSWIRHPCLEMDTVGNTILLWEERKTQGKEEPSYVRFQRFGPDGSPVGSAHTVVARVFLYKRSPIDLSLNNRGEFAVTWLEVIPPYWELTSVWAQRFDLDGYPENQAFLTHDVPGGDYLLPFTSPRVALNDEGDLVVTWRDQPNPDTVHRRFQVFDAADEPILSWRPRGHLLDYEEWGKWAEPYWLDDDRFVTFWVKNTWPYGLVGEVFTHRGLARYPIRTVVVDTLASRWCVNGGDRDFSVAFSSDDRFAETHERGYSHWDPLCLWEHGGGVLGEIRDNEPWRRTNLFEYTPPLGKDTAWDIFCATTAVAVCDDRIVWVYTRPNPDSILEAWALISDWDMGVGVVESPIQTESPIRLETSLNRLFYDVSGSVMGEAKLTLYSSDGRRVLTETVKGKGIWDAPALPQGVYFARVSTEGYSARTKVIVLR
ncbi:T9SS type A sorting domain-containing protein, partial [candidate division WOR-3 bacterium]|nr:T9SS type A sorting domain-containing protein [candidate division WOR-3 bacterium]